MSVIYALKNPRRPNVVRYVGHTRNQPNGRLFEHMATAFSARPANPYLAKWLRKMASANTIPLLEVLEAVGHDVDWEARERHWIEYYSGPHLLNIQVGGRGFRSRLPEHQSAQREHALALSKKNIGRVWINNGVRNLWWPGDAPVPEGYTRGRLFDSQAIGDRARGAAWITDGKNNRQLMPGEVMPPAFRPGRTIRRGYQAALAYRHGSGWRGSTWITDGTSTRRLRQGEPVPDGWRAGRLDMQWITDGVRTRRLMPSMQMPDGWRRGRSLKPTTP